MVASVGTAATGVGKNIDKNVLLPTKCDIVRDERNRKLYIDQKMSINVRELSGCVVTGRGKVTGDKNPQNKNFTVCE